MSSLEKQVLGLVLTDEKSMDVAMTHLGPANFVKTVHREIYTAAMCLADEGSPVNAVSVSQELEKGKWLRKTSPGEVIKKITDECIKDKSPEYYINQLKGRSLRKKTAELCDEFIQNKITRDDLVIALQDTDTVPREYVRHIGDDIESTVDYIESMQNRERSVFGITTGLADLDKRIGGIRKGNYVVVGGRPSHCKTLLILAMVRHVAEHYGPVYVISVESSHEEIVYRMVLSEAGVSEDRIKSGYCGSKEWARMTTAAGIIKQLPIYICDKPDINPAEMRARARQFARRHENTALIVVDYLQNIETGFTDDFKSVTVASKSACRMGKELKIPTIVASQLSRAPEKRKSPRPKLSDLRQSGQIEQDADIVLLLNYKYRNEGATKDDKYRLQVFGAKQREGPPFEIEVRAIVDQKKVTNAEV